MIRKLIPDDSGLDLQHLRRFAKYTDVPESIRLLFEAKKMEYDQSHEVDMPSEAPSKLFLVVGSVNAISRTTLVDALSAIAKNIVLFTAHVPMLAPTSQKQATQWTSQYWPTVYKKSNPFGPHPSIVARAEEEIRGDVQKWMDLADKVAQESRQSDSGEAVGVVIVDRKDGNARPVAVAGDARWFGWPRCGAGNVTAHAALRAIAMVAARLRPEEQATGSENSQVEKFDKTISDNHDEFDVDASVTTAASVRLLGKSSLPTRKTSTNVNEQVGGLIEDLPRNKGDENADHDIVPKKDGIFQDRPLFTIEAQNHPQSNNGDGYLCHGLEIYCSHEPCVMCSMAIVHSRFGKIVFARRMRETGGLCADGQLGHGLFWRKELNWTMLAWQWFDSMHTDAEVTPALFHA
jgi:tRNA-specific adenosine deaminase 3